MFYIAWLSSLGNFLDITLMNISSVFGSYFTYLLLNQTWAHTRTCSKAKLLTPSWSGSEACFPPLLCLGPCHKPLLWSKLCCESLDLCTVGTETFAWSHLLLRSKLWIQNHMLNMYILKYGSLLTVFIFQQKS